LPANLVESCKGLSTAAQAIAERWVKSRSEQAQATLEVCAKLASCKSPSEFAELQQRWWQGTVDQLSAEMKGYQDQILALSQMNPTALLDSKPASRRT
jgi:hypothetical protein